MEKWEKMDDIARFEWFIKLRSPIRGSDNHLIVGIDIAKNKHHAFFGTPKGQSLWRRLIFTTDHYNLLDIVPFIGTVLIVKRKNQKTLRLIFAKPVSGNIKWHDIESLFIDLGAELSEREGSRIGVRLFGERRVFHRPHPSPSTDKGAVASIRKWLQENGIKP